MRQYSILASIVLIFWGIASCESSKKSSDKEHKDNQPMSVQDTLPPTPKPVPPAPAPGTVRIKGRVVDVYNDENDTKTVDIYVLKTLAYGASTPAVAVHDTMHISIIEKKGLTKGATITGTLKYREAMMGAKTAHRNWQLVNFSNDKD